MEALFAILLQTLPLWLLLLAWLAGSTTQRRHYRRLNVRSRRLAHMLVSDVRSFPRAVAPPGAKPPSLVVCEAVIATDYLKSFLANLRKVFGGEVRSYLSLLERARKEALLKVLEEAHGRGYNAVCNLRLEAADIGGNIGTKGAAMVTMVATATAYHAADPEARV